jgi:hypothetical protein
MAPAWSKKIKLNYFEQTVTAEHKKEAFYQMKEATRIEGPWTDEDKEIYIPRQFRIIKFYPWQQAVYAAHYSVTVEL